MADVAVDHEIYRLSAEQYHLLIESGGVRREIAR